MIVWRVENKNKTGPYTEGLSQETPIRLDAGPVRVLNPHWKPEENNLFGFQTLQQLKSQFSRAELQRLRRFGFRIRRLEVLAIATSDEHCFFASRNIVRRCITLGTSKERK